MNNKPDYIVELEKREHKFFSVTQFGEIKSKNEIDDSSFENVYQESIWVDSKPQWTKKILKTKQPFYLYIERNELYKNIFHIKIYHTPEQINELIFFVRNFLKTIN